ncbi:ATP-dependent DNA helicase pif1, partial [Brachionus plicatilis]
MSSFSSSQSILVEFGILFKHSEIKPRNIDRSSAHINGRNLNYYASPSIPPSQTDPVNAFGRILDSPQSYYVQSTRTYDQKASHSNGRNLSAEFDKGVNQSHLLYNSYFSPSTYNTHNNIQNLNTHSNEHLNSTRSSFQAINTLHMNQIMAFGSISSSPNINFVSSPQSSIHLNGRNLNFQLDKMSHVNRPNQYPHPRPSTSYNLYSSPSIPTSQTDPVNAFGRILDSPQSYYVQSTSIVNTIGVQHQANSIQLNQNHSANSHILQNGIQPKKCKCGSISHQRINHRECPLNKIRLSAFINDDIESAIEAIESTTQIVPTITDHTKKTSNARSYLIARKKYDLKKIIGKYIDTDPDSENFGSIILPKRIVICQYCSASTWIEEKSDGTLSNPQFGICCAKGRVLLPTQNPPPEEIFELLTDNSTEAQDFRKNIRLYNKILSFTSIKSNYNRDLMKSTSGVYTYRINGPVVQRISNLKPDDSQNPIYSQIYLYDPEFQAKYRENKFKSVININILNRLQNSLMRSNPYVKLYQQLGKRFRTDPSLNLNIVLKKHVAKDKRYNLPTAQEVAALISNEDSKAVKNEFSLISINTDDPNGPNSLSTDTSLKVNDEIEKFIDMQYISAPECIWRLFHFGLTDQYPKTRRLPVHLPNRQTCFFKANDPKEKIFQTSNETELTAFFKLNKKKPDLAKQYFYYEIPKYFTFNEKEKDWKAKSRIGEGKEKRYKDPNGYDDLIELPEQLINHFDKEGLIKQIFLNICTNSNPHEFIDSAILCPTNEEVDSINEIAT